jgi:site-specific DNA-methyltransferase (adenine-specific)
MITKDTILNADILETLPQIPDGTFDCCVLDVPYEQEAHGRGFASQRGIYSEMSEYTSLENDWYSEDLMREYCRICKFPNLFCFGSKRDVWKLLKFSEANGCYYDIIPVCKKSPVPFTNNNWLTNEYAVHITDRKLGYNKEYNLKIPYFIVGGQKTTGHPNEKDLPMMKRIVANITQEGDFVFDGFMGSGTTALACQQLKRHFFGCEINKDYYEKALKRLDDESRQGELF